MNLRSCLDHADAAGTGVVSLTTATLPAMTTAWFTLVVQVMPADGRHDYEHGQVT